MKSTLHKLKRKFAVLQLRVPTPIDTKIIAFSRCDPLYPVAKHDLSSRTRSLHFQGDKSFQR